MASFVVHVLALRGRSGWRVTWYRNGRVLTRPFRVSGAYARAALDLGREFLQLAEQPGRPLAHPDLLRGFRRKLFRLFFRPVWQPWQAGRASGLHELLVRSTDRRVLNLPWELVELLPGVPLGCDAAWALRRTSLGRLAPRPQRLEPGPLRILFLASAPSDLPALDHEHEEDAIRRTAGLFRDHVRLQVAPTRTFEELAERVSEFRPHVVVLPGHGKVDGPGRGAFAFEARCGRADSRDARTLVAGVFRGSPVRCVFVNGCQSSQAATAGLCQALVEAGVPLALGWSANVGGGPGHAVPAPVSGGGGRAGPRARPPRRAPA